MKKLFKSLKQTLKQKLPGSDQNLKPQIITSQQYYERILLSHTQKLKILAKINHIMYESKFQQIPKEIQDACEIVHYACFNDEPVKAIYVKIIDKDFDISNNPEKDEQLYDEWLKYKENMEYELQDKNIEVEDIYGLRPEDGSKGRSSQESWNFNKQSKKKGY